ncbi:uncharacterized protein LOC141613293 [Silene latifolia]|uniref:uncharacterized protein LOC141613293 n=1 Tax=Silene latifolia TaxID=37657 RepID=UPI003D78A138
MTCNTNWPEIKRELARGEEAQNRPDIVARVFRAKLVALKKKIMEEQIFGEVAAFIYVVEFQKRGLPHAHFLIILKTPHKIINRADFDRFVCAEIPSVTNAELRASVLKHMMHGPCSKLDPECSCMHHKKTKGHCKYGYPKEFTTETTNNSDGYPEYRRRNNGEKATIRKQELDNRWVIPYNPYMMSLFDCHLNVEVCSTIQAVKYLYKYVYKGHDKISFNVTAADTPQVIDEIEHFQSGRWVSPCEAMWRIYGIDLYEMQPPVIPLQIHLPNMQSIQIRPHEDLENVISNEKRTRTPLTEWDTKDRTWFKRKTKLLVIGRLVFVAPAEGERYYLRLLLQHVRGPKSYVDLKTVYGVVCATFQEAALQLRLLEADNTVEMCLDEAIVVQMPFALRRLFATILIFCQPKDLGSLWEKYYSALSEDYMHQFPNNAHKIRELTYRSIEQILEAMGRSMKSFGLNHLSEQVDIEILRMRDIVDALEAPIPDDCIACIGGTSKTFLYNALYAEVHLMGKIVLPTATSGIAASNIPSGRTNHSRFKLPVDLDASLSCDVPKQGSLAALLREAALLI